MKVGLGSAAREGRATSADASALLRDRCQIFLPAGGGYSSAGVLQGIQRARSGVI